MQIADNIFLEKSIMNPIYVALFSVMLDHGYGVDYKPNVEHKCDPLAMNIAQRRSGRVGADADNQAYPIRAFLYNKEMDCHLARATPSPKMPDSQNSAHKFCHVPYLERSCGPLRHAYNFLEDYDENYDLQNGLLGIKLHIRMIGMSLETGRAILYEMDIVGINEDDYIFQWLEGTQITAHEIDENGLKVEIPSIPDRVLQSLKSEFAIHAIYLEKSWGEDLDGAPPLDEEDDDIMSTDESDHVVPTLYINDNDTPASVSMSDGDDDASRTRNESEELEENEISDTENDDNIYCGKARTFAIFVSCDGRSIWASYNKWAADQDNEADSAFVMDEMIVKLQDTIKELQLIGQFNYPNVKPVSTYMPERFDAAT